MSFPVVFGARLVGERLMRLAGVRTLADWGEMVSSATAGRLARLRVVDGGVSRIFEASSRSGGGGERGVSESEAIPRSSLFRDVSDVIASFFTSCSRILLLRNDLLEASARTSLAVSCEALDVLMFI